jgi:filamentous hemagglutinin family protein
MKPRCGPFWFAGNLSLLLLATASPTPAQIVQDTTLPNPSLVTPNGNTSVITGGTQAGSNLFHSFSEFSVPTGGVASFQQVDQGIKNIISRVTGSSVSNIDGLIEVLQSNGTRSSADFFLINPNGILFGPNASLNVGGSFLTSTASSLNFTDGSSFSATNPQTTAPLLTVSVPLGLQFGSSARSIQVQGAELQVPYGKTLGLLGGNLVLVGGKLRALGGRIELGSVGGAVTPNLAPVQVSLTPINRGWALGYQGVENFQDIQLSQTAIVNASGQGAGDIQVQGRRVTLTDGSQITANTQGAGIGGTLAVTAEESVEISGTSTYGFLPSGLFADVAPAATGSGGNLTIKTRQLLVQDGATVSASTLGLGTGGNLTVQATESVLVSGTDDSRDKFGSSLRATVEQGATGDGGNLTIDTRQLTVRDGAQVLTATFGEGNAGNLIVQNATKVELVGGIVVDGKFDPSGLFNQTRGTGAGGNLLISTGSLIVRDGAEVSATTFGPGDAGDVTVRASEAELLGVALSTDGQFIANDRGLSFPSGLFAGTDIGSTGAGGTLRVETNRLSLRDGAVVQTSALGAGDAGDLIVQATDSVEVIGTFADNRFPTSLLAVSGGIPGVGGVVDATGRAGNLTLETGKLTVQDGGTVAVSSLNPNSDAKGAGDLQITAQTIQLDNRGKLTAATASGDGGNMTLQVQDLLLLRRNSEISTTAGIGGAGGNGGNITIDAKDGFIVAVPSENSDITANAFTGNGGNIQITVQGIFGTQFREDLTPKSDITASSQFGVNGVVVINTPDVDPSRGLVALPTDVVDASGLIASGCGAPQRIAQGQFLVTGRGGLPPSPSEPLRSNTIWNDLRPTTQQAQNLPSAAVTRPPTSPTKGQLVEAQGWMIGSDGRVILTAEARIVCATGR